MLNTNNNFMLELTASYKVIVKRVSLALFFCLFTSLAFAQVQLTISSATASSTYSSYSASKTIDNNLSTYWRGYNNKVSWWLRLDLGAAYTLSQISIWWHKDYGSSNYNIQVSTNGSRWTNAYTALSSLGGAQNPYQRNYTISGSYRYVRIYINKAQGTYPIIYEVKLYGENQPSILSISVNPKLWNIGTVTVNNVVTMTQSSKITVTNDGSDPETFSLTLVNPSGWTGSTVPGQESYVLSGIFCNTTDVPEAINFNQDAVSEDTITTVYQKATNAILGYAQSTANGVSVPANSSRSLYLQFKSPTITQKNDEQNISVIVSCQVP